MCIRDRSLGTKVGLLTVGLYLFEGILGLPVFANSPEKGIGIIYFTGPTMGYLIGFLFAVYFSGKFQYNKGLLNTFTKLIFSVSFIYIIGLLWLGILIGWEKPLFKIGAQPFLLAELFKILLLTFLSTNLTKLKKFSLPIFEIILSDSIFTISGIEGIETIPLIRESM